MIPLRSIEDYRAVFDAAPDGILLVDRSGRILQANREALRLFRYEDSGLVDRAIEELVPEDLRAVHREHRAGYLENPHSRPMGMGLELSGVRRDGVRIPIEISLSPLDSAQGPVVIAIVRDLTERNRLKGFGIAALNAAEEERRRIARELHDETAQELATLLMRLAVLERRTGPGELADGIEEIRRDVASIGEGVRRIARGLRPPELEDVGLAAALRSFVRARFEGPDIELSFDGSEARLGSAQGLAAYRVAQEALTNVVRHAQARNVSLTVSAGGPTEVILEVRDDGRGFVPDSEPEFPGGLGVLGMQERADFVGGTLEIHSEPGVGTTVRLRLDTTVEEA